MSSRVFNFDLNGFAVGRHQSKVVLRSISGAYNHPTHLDTEGREDIVRNPIQSRLDQLVCASRTFEPTAVRVLLCERRYAGAVRPPPAAFECRAHLFFRPGQNESEILALLAD